ncbi:hypothetical protein, conserved [Babesia ovata]|uniref:Uncharacterized protein n=1 Tax=Babesia ovata TaxID=189622 RepID=A0A2H6KA21_9APIC|nr:uncharacterized protein BOVATA_012920 [Babesia ovata]GBE59799.1 hypothetical protein, conserved [Babesia ovata]
MYNPNNPPTFNYVPQDPSVHPLQQAPMHVPMDPGYRNVTVVPPIWPGNAPVPVHSPLPGMRPWPENQLMLGGIELPSQAYRSPVSYNTAPLVSTPSNQDMLNLEHLRPNLGTPPSGTNVHQLLRTPSLRSLASGRGSGREEPTAKGKGRVGHMMPINKLLGDYEGPPIAMFDAPRIERPDDPKPYVPMFKQMRVIQTPGLGRKISLGRLEDDDSDDNSTSFLHIPTSKLADFASKTFGNVVRSIAPPKIAIPLNTRPLVPPGVIDSPPIMSVAPMPPPYPPPMGVVHPTPLLPPPSAMIGMAPAVVPMPEMHMQEAPIVSMDVPQPMAVPIGIPFDPNNPMPFPGPAVVTPVARQKMPVLSMPSIGTAEGVASAELLSQMRDPVAYMTPHTPTVRVKNKGKGAGPVSAKSNMSMSGLSSASYPVQYTVTPAMGMPMPMDGTALGTPSPPPPAIGFAVNATVPTPIATPYATPVGMAMHAPMSMPSCIAPMVPIASGPLTISLQPPPMQTPIVVPDSGVPASAGAISHQPEESILDEIKKEKNVDQGVDRKLVSAPRIIVESYQKLLEKKRNRLRECLVEDCRAVLGERGKIDIPYQSTEENGRYHFYVRDIVAKLLPYHVFYYEDVEHKPKPPSKDLDVLEERVQSLKNRLMSMAAQAKITQQNYECTKACVDALRNVVRKREATQCGRLSTI